MKSRIFVLALLLFFLTWVGTAYASNVKLEFDLRVTSRWDYVAKSLDPTFTPFSSTLQILFPYEIHSINYYPTTVHTFFGWVGDTVINSPITPILLPSPFQEMENRAYTFAATNTFDTQYAESVGFRWNNYHNPSDSDIFWDHNLEFTLKKFYPGTPPENFPYAFNNAQLITFLEGIEESGEEFYFSEYSYLYNTVTKTYPSGTGYHGYVQLTNVEVEAVPIPGVIYLFASGLVGLAGIRKKLKG